MNTHPPAILKFWHVFGTATCIWPLPAAHSHTRDRESRSLMLRVTAGHLRFSGVGRLGLEPRTGGL